MDVLPSSFFLHGVEPISQIAIAGGGFADIYKGKYLGREVALKVIRAFRGGEGGERKKLKVSP